MSNSYVLLEKVVVGSAGASSVTFANIPQTGYTDLVVKYSARVTASATFSDLNIRFNGSTSGYSERMLAANGTVAFSAAASGSLINWGASDGSTATASTFSNGEIYLPNYAGSNNKSMSQDVVTENNSGATNSVTMNLHAALWSNAAAITSIDLIPSSGTLVANSTFYLYGVAKLGTTPTIAPKATGGDVIDTDGTYWYHIFRSSGTFTPATALTADCLIVAGGGGGGGATDGSIGGGGGAGGYQSLTSQSLTTTAYSVTIGAGGTRGTGSASGTPTSGTAGSNSVFGALTASVGGGFGGGGDGNGTGFSGGNGGSGGGAGFSNATSTTGGTGTAGQGNAGGNEGTGGGGAGGGGAGGAGTAPSAGAGLANSITGTSITYASGGSGAGTAGSGVVPSDPTANRGIGGDSGWNANGANGGSGIVVVRYLVA